MSDHFISRDRAEGDLLDCAAFLAERIKSVEGHAEAMNVVIPLYLAKNEVDISAELANAIDDPYSRDRLLMNVAVRCAEIDDDEYAMQLAEAIEDRGLQSQAFERIGLIVASKGMHDRAAEVADMMDHPDLVYAGVAADVANRISANAAEEAIAQIDFPTARVTALQQIGTDQIGRGDTAKGIETIAEAVAAAGEIEHDEERIRTLCELASLLIDAKANDKAIETFEIARAEAEKLDNQHRDPLLVNCALGFLAAGSTELAERTLDLITEKTAMASALLGLARHQWAKNEREDAVDSLDEAHEILRSQRENEIRDSRARNALLTTVAVQFAAYGKWERATEIAQDIPNPEQTMNALAQIAQILTINKQDDLARETLNQIDEDSNRLFALVGLADAKRKNEDNAAAIALLEEAASLADSVPQMSSRSEVLNEIATRLIDLGETEKARGVARHNFEVITEIRDEASRAAALAQLGTIYEQGSLELGEPEKTALASLAAKAYFE